MPLAQYQGLPPGARGYMIGEGQAQEAGQRNLANLTQATQLQGALQKMQLEQAWKNDIAALGPNPTDEQLAAVARKHGGANAVMADLTRRTQIKSTQETARSRLAQAEAIHNQDYQLKLRSATTAEQRAAVDAWDKQVRAYLANERSQFLSSGESKGIPGLVMPSAAPPAAPTDPLAGRPQNELDAVAALQGRLAQGQMGSITTSPGQPNSAFMPSAQPSPVAQPAPVSAPQAVVAPPVEAPMTPATAYGPEGRFPPIGKPPVATAGPVTPGQVIAPVGTPPIPEKKPGEFTPNDAPVGMKGLARVQWARDRNKPSIAGAGLLSPEALTFTAQQYLTGDRQAVQGYARNTTARVALQNEIVAEAKRQGITGPALAAKMADFAGIMAGSRSVGTRQAQIELASNEALQMIKIVEDTSAKFGRTNFVPFNVALKAFDTGTGQPEIKAFGTAINSLVNVYARAINPVGIPTIQDKEHARELLATINSPAQVDAVLGILKQEMTAARTAPNEVREALKNAITGKARRRESDKPATGGWSIVR